MKDLVYFGHGKVLLDFNDEEVDHFLIRLQQVDRILALADEDFCLLAGQKLGVFLMDDGGVSELE
jgi:hypothetical protein